MSVWNIHSWPAVTLASLAMSTYQFHDPPELHLFVIAVAWEGRLRLWSDGHLGPWVDTASWILLCSWPRDYLWQEFVADVRAGADAAERWILNVCSKYVSSIHDWRGIQCLVNTMAWRFFRRWSFLRLVRRLQNYSLLSPYGALRMGVDMYGQSKSTIELIIQPILSL